MHDGEEKPAPGNAGYAVEEETPAAITEPVAAAAPAAPLPPLEADKRATIARNVREAGDDLQLLADIFEDDELGPELVAIIEKARAKSL